jgi:hypothetical protein
MLLTIPAGTTSKIIEFPIFDSSSTTGALLAGLAWNSGSLTAYYDRVGAAGAATAITLATMTKGTWVTLGFVAVDGTNMPGIYQLGVPDAALAAGATQVTINLKGATNMVPVVIVIQLTSVTDYPVNATQINGVATTSVTTIPANLGTTQPINFTGTGASALAKVDVTDIATAAVSTTTAQIGANVVSINAVAASGVTTVSPYQGTTQPLNFTGTGATAYPKVDVTDIATAAVSATTAQIGANVVNWNNTVVATPAAAGIPDVNVKNMNNVAATSITTVAANQGTTQPVNFTGTAGSALAKVDVTDIATAAVATGTAQLGVNVVTQANIDFGAAQKSSLNAATPASVQNISAQTGDSYARIGANGASLTGLGGFTAGAINNAAFNADVASTAYASNTLAQMMYKFFDNAFTGYADGSTFTANGLLDRLTKLLWIMRNKMTVVDASGNTVVYKDDNATAAFTVAGALTDDSTTTTRLRMA